MQPPLALPRCRRIPPLEARRALAQSSRWPRKSRMASRSPAGWRAHREPPGAAHLASRSSSAQL
eukprot:scaffold1036_cov343-Prasinococcus_capsulatus_cf.AAC.7